MSAQDVTIDSLQDGPGILPFKLGQAKITSHYHSFLQHVNLNDIYSQIKSVRLQLLELKPHLNNKTLSLFDPHISHLDSKIINLVDKLKTFESHRSKRGLIDGLGSVIKSISGNLDYTDALKYDSAIRVLQSNDNTLELELNNHISLTKEWMSEHSSIVDSVVNNQRKITNTLNSLVYNSTNRDKELVKYAQWHNVS